MDGVVGRNVTCSCVFIGRPKADCAHCGGSGIRDWKSRTAPQISNNPPVAAVPQGGPSVTRRSPCCQAEAYGINCTNPSCRAELRRCAACGRSHAQSGILIDRCPRCGYKGDL